MDGVGDIVANSILNNTTLMVQGDIVPAFFSDGSFSMRKETEISSLLTTLYNKFSENKKK